MTLKIYENIQAIEEKLGEKPEGWEKKVYYLEKKSFDEILRINKTGKQNVYFSLKNNWRLLKENKYVDVLCNIKAWLRQADSRYDGKAWNDDDQTSFEDEVCDIEFKEGKLIFLRAGLLHEFLERIEAEEDFIVEVNLK